MTKAEQHLERPVSFTTAVKKLATLRGHHSKVGGWIYNEHGYPVCHGWDTYGRRFCKNLIVQDADHNGGNGKWYVWVIGLDAKQLELAERLWSRTTVTKAEQHLERPVSNEQLADAAVDPRDLVYPVRCVSFSLHRLLRKCGPPPSFAGRTIVQAIDSLDRAESNLRAMYLVNPEVL